MFFEWIGIMVFLALLELMVKLILFELDSQKIDTSDCSNSKRTIVKPCMKPVAGDNRILPEKDEEPRKLVIGSQKYICDSVSKDRNSIVTRHNQTTCHELYEFDRNTPSNKKRIILPKGEVFTCYGCGTGTNSSSCICF